MKKKNLITKTKLYISDIYIYIYIWKLFVLVFMLYRETVCACVNVNNAQFLDHVCVVVYTLTANNNKI